MHAGSVAVPAAPQVLQSGLHALVAHAVVARGGE
jgi:hypothetical protein